MFLQYVAVCTPEISILVMNFSFCFGMDRKERSCLSESLIQCFNQNKSQNFQRSAFSIPSGRHYQRSNSSTHFRKEVQKFSFYQPRSPSKVRAQHTWECCFSPRLLAVSLSNTKTSARKRPSREGPPWIYIEFEPLFRVTIFDSTSFLQISGNFGDSKLSIRFT